MAKSAVLHIRVTPQVKKLIEKAAEKDRRKPSDYGAMLLEAGAKATLGIK